jgi:hypothetical protein
MPCRDTPDEPCLAAARDMRAHDPEKWLPVFRKDHALHNTGAGSDAKPVSTFADRALLATAI